MEHTVLSVDEMLAPGTLAARLATNAYRWPDDLAYTFAPNAGADRRSLTYAELDQRVRALAASLLDRGLEGERVLLLHPAGLDYVIAFFACCYARITAVPAHPPGQGARLSRLEHIACDADVRLALTVSSAVERGEGSFEWIASDAIELAMADDFVPPKVTPEDAALLQYTSGSTSSPRGVVITHDNLMHNAAGIERIVGTDRPVRGVSWLPPQHDMGLLGGILQPVVARFPVSLFSPMGFLKRPMRWLEEITRFGGTLSAAPNFAYERCVRAALGQDIEHLDLSTWSVAITGAEPVRASTISRFCERFGPIGFSRQAIAPCYGLAEATLLVTGKVQGRLPTVVNFDREALAIRRAVVTAEVGRESKSVVGCGEAHRSTTVTIVDSATREPVDDGVVGEIWVSGPTVARGYFAPSTDNSGFDARIAGDDARYLATGDVGFVLDGELFVTGRSKDLIVIRGRNVFPQDVEHTVERSHPAFRPNRAAAFAVEHADTDRLVVVQELERKHRALSADDLVGVVRGAVAAHHDVHVHTVVFIRHGALPMTTSGKVQRREIRRRYLAGELEVVTESAQTVEAHGRGVVGQLQGQLSEMLDVEPGAIAPDRPLAELGLDSLMVVDLSRFAAAELGVAVDLRKLDPSTTLDDLARLACASDLEPEPESD